MAGSSWVAVAICVVAVLARPREVTASPPAPETRDQRVLILNSYHPQYAWTDALVRSALAELRGAVPEENVHVEYMDARRMLDDAPYLGDVAALLAAKYRRWLPDVILVSDDGATRFLLDHRDRLFPGVPIVFCGINSIPQAELEAVPGMTGIMEGMEIEGNLRLIERLHPGLRRIVMLADRSSLGRGMTATARAVPAAAVVVEREVWDDFTLPELRRRVAATGTDTAFLMLAIHRDREGRYFSFARELPGLTASTRAPMYGMFGMLLGTGVVGGIMNDPSQHGGAAAAMVRRVLGGTRVDDIPIIAKAEYLPRFHWQALRRLGIDADQLPPGSQIVGRPFSLYERYRTVIWSVAAIVLALLAISASLLYLVVRMRAAERALVASHRALQCAQRAEVVGQLAGGIAHDFNNLLTPILVATTLLRRKLSGQQLADVEMVQAAAARAQDLARQLLSLGRDQALTLRAVDLGAALPPVLSLLEKGVGATIGLALEPGTSGLVAEADLGQVERVIVNLVMNARDAAIGDRPVHIAVTATAVELSDRAVDDLDAGRYVRLRVADDGRGMDAATVQQIFEPFFTTKERGRGAGLGLSSAQAIVRQHGGAITVESAPGRGTRFDVYLRASGRPVASEPPVAVAKDAAAAPLPPWSPMTNA